MNLNDFVVLPNNKAKSVKLNARNLRELQMETVTSALESKEMEEKLQQLKESMSKEKEERGLSGGFRWKSGKCGSLSSNAPTNATTKNRLLKLSAGKVKIRVLKDEPLTAQPQPPPPLQKTRKNRLVGKYCGQCEVKTAGVKCAECSEDYCVGCFTLFHHKGALKLHTMIPIQRVLQTHVTTPDVVSFQKQMNPNSSPSTYTNPALAKPVQLHPDSKQVLTVSDEDKREEVTEGGSLLKGEYNEEECARSFQEALRQWRGEKSDGSEDHESEDPLWTPVRPVSVSAMATQADLSPDRGAEGRGRGTDGRVLVRVEFGERSLTYMDRLLLKKHRRTPIETYRPSLAFSPDLKSLPNTNTGEESASVLTAQEEAFRRYWASLFAVPVSRAGTEPQIFAPEPCLVIEVMDETDRDIHGVPAADQTDSNTKVPIVQQDISKETLLPHTALITSGSSTVSRSSPSPAQPLRKSRAPAQLKAVQKNHHTKHRSPREERRTKSSSSKSKPLACPTAETPRTSKTLIKTPTSTSQKPISSRNFHKSNPDPGSIRLVSSPSLAHSQTEIPKSLYSPVLFAPDVSPIASTRSLIPEQRISPSSSMSCLRSTFTVTPSSSIEGTLLPEVYQSRTLQKGSDSLLSKQPKCKDSSFFMSSTPCPDEHDVAQDIQCIPPLTSPFYDVIKNPPLVVKVESEEELSMDSGDEMSSDSLGLAPHEEDSSDEEAQIHGRLTRGSSSTERGNPAISHTEDPFVPADADREKDLQSDEQEQLSQASMVMMHNQRAGPRSERFCSLDGFVPLGLDMNYGHSDTPEHTHRDARHTYQTSPRDSDPTEGYGLRSSLNTFTEEHLVFRTMKNNHMQPSETQIHSTRPTRRQEISANELGTSELSPAFRALSRAAEEIMEICNVDQTGCEDPDLDADALHSLEQELGLMAKVSTSETLWQASVSDTEDSGSQDYHENNWKIKWDQLSEEQSDEEASAQGDRQSVFLLP